MDLTQGSLVCLAMIKDGLEGIHFTYVRYIYCACVCNGCLCVCLCTTVYRGKLEGNNRSQCEFQVHSNHQAGKKVPLATEPPCQP